jgi:N-acetyl sugar amidotransferase
MDNITDVFIHFGEKGNCNHCEDYLQRTSKLIYNSEISDEKWKHILDKIKSAGKNRKFDCIVGISGGVDSSYTAHLCKEYGLRTLLFHMDNGWDTKISVNNVATMVDKLGFEYDCKVLDWEAFREIQLAFLKSSIVDLEMPTDIAILASIYKAAAKYDIKYIFSGGNLSSEAIMPLQMGYHMYKDIKLYRHIVKKYSKKALKTIPTVGIWGEFYYKFLKNIKTVYPLNYIPYNKDKAKQFLIEQYGWEDYGGKHHESKITAFWQSYVMPEKYKMDYRRTTLSAQICAGQISRAAALNEFLHKSYDEKLIDEDKKYISKKFGISLEELEKYLSNPPKTYLDFPNNKKLISFVYRTYNRIFTKKRI